MPVSINNIRQGHAEIRFERAMELPVVPTLNAIIRHGFEFVRSEYDQAAMQMVLTVELPLNYCKHFLALREELDRVACWSYTVQTLTHREKQT